HSVCRPQSIPYTTLFRSTVAAAARNGLITVHTSLELVAERLRARSTGRGIRGDLWIAVRFEHAPAPLDRSTWMGSLSLQQMASKDRKSTRLNSSRQLISY